MFTQVGLGRLVGLAREVGLIPESGGTSRTFHVEGNTEDWRSLCKFMEELLFTYSIECSKETQQKRKED